MTYEWNIRKCFEYSINLYNDSFKQCIEKLEECSGLESINQSNGLTIDLNSALKAGYDPVFWTFMRKWSVLSIKLKFDKESKLVIYDPSLEKWKDEIFNFVDNIW